MPPPPTSLSLTPNPPTTFFYFEFSSTLLAMKFIRRDLVVTTFTGRVKGYGKRATTYDYQSTYLANLIPRYFHCPFLGPITAKPEGGKLVRMQMKSMDIPRWNVVSEPDPQIIKRRVMVHQLGWRCTLHPVCRHTSDWLLISILVCIN